MSLSQPDPPPPLPPRPRPTLRLVLLTTAPDSPVHTSSPRTTASRGFEGSCSGSPALAILSDFAARAEAFASWASLWKRWSVEGACMVVVEVKGEYSCSCRPF